MSSVMKKIFYSFIICTLLMSNVSAQNFWEQTNGPKVEGTTASCLAINSSDYIFVGTNDGLFRSTNNGDNWNEVIDGLTTVGIHAIAIKQNDYIIPGGSMVATAQDVGIFLRALMDGTLFNDEEQAIYSSIYQYEHTGELPGYQSIARYHADMDAVVIQFNNISGGNSWSKSESVYRRIIRILEREN